MKFLAFLAAAAVAIVSAADVPACDLNKLFAISTTTAATTCKSETGFAPTPGTFPSADKVALICKNSNCQTVLAALSAANPTECLFSGVPLRSGILDKYATACAALATTTAPPATTTPPATTAPTTAPPSNPATTVPSTTKPASTTAPTTAAPSSTTTAPSTPNATVEPSADTPKVTPSGRCKV